MNPIIFLLLCHSHEVTYQRFTMSFTLNHLKLATISDSLGHNRSLLFHKTITIIMCSSQLGEVIWNLEKCAAQVVTTKWAEPSATLSTGARSVLSQCQQCQQPPIFSQYMGTPTSWPEGGDSWDLGLACAWPVSQLWVFSQPVYWHSEYWGQNHSARQWKVGVF